MSFVYQVYVDSSASALTRLLRFVRHDVTEFAMTFWNHFSLVLPLIQQASFTHGIFFVVGVFAGVAEDGVEATVVFGE